MAGDVVTTASAAPVLRDDYSTSEPGERRAGHSHQRTTRMQHSRPGTISSIDAHSDGKHATIRVTHGKRKKNPDTGELQGYHRMDSHVTIPKAAAKGYAIGQRVNAGISPMDAEDQADGGADEAAEGEAPMPQAAPPTVAAKAKAKKKGAGPKKKAPPSRIAAALNPRGY